MKKIIKLLSIFLLSFCCYFSFNITEAHSEDWASWRTNAYHFINKYGECKALYMEGKFWFATKSTTASSTVTLRYRTLGYGFRLITSTGGSYEVATNIGGGIKEVDSQSLSDGYTYTIWNIDYSSLMDMYYKKYPNVDFSDLVNRKISSLYHIDPYITVVDNGVVKGWMSSNGSTSSNYVWHDKNVNLSNKYPYVDPYTGKKYYGWISDSEWQNKFFTVTVPGSSKQVPSPKVSPISVFSVDNEREYYGSGDTYFIRPGNSITLQFRSSVSYYDKYNRIGVNYFALRDYNNSWKATTTQNIGHDAYNSDHINIDKTYVDPLNIVWGSTVRENNVDTLVKAKFNYKNDGEYYTFFPSADMTFKGITQLVTRVLDWDTSKDFTLISDGTAPVASSSSQNYDVSKDVVSLSVSGVSDISCNGTVPASGVRTSSIYAVIYPKSNPNNRITVPLSGSGSYSGSYSFNSYNSDYGDYTVEYWGTDNVSNEGVMHTDGFTRVPPNPTTTSVLIKDYEYEDSTTKWVKANDEFQIFQEGYSLVGNPTGSHIRISKSETDIQNPYYSNAYALTADGWYSWDTNTKYLVKNRDTYLKTSTKSESGETRYYGTANYYYTASPNLNGQKFYVLGTTSITINGIAYDGEYLRDPKMLGIDGEAPILNYSVSNNVVSVSVEDKESGFNRAEVTIDGVKKTYTTPNFTINSGSSITVVVYDNVGNSSTHTIKRDGWDGKYIKTWVGEVNGKKVLKYSVDAEKYDYWIDNNNNVIINNHTLRFTAESTKYIKPMIIKTATNKIHYENLVEDKYNQTYGPTLRYEKNNSTYAYIRWEHIEDIEDQVDLKLYDDGNPWDSVRKYFASGRKNYKWTLYQTKDRYGNSITKKKVGSGTVTRNEIDVSGYKTGSYEIEVTMYDYNGNPSGTSVIPFDHVQPHIKTDISDLFLKVTAVKDLNWESMDYPIKYNSLEFPLGKNKLSKTGEGIKLGYAVNLSIENLIKHSLSDYSATYILLGENGEFLTGESNGKTFAQSDSQDKTGYLTQNKTHITLAEDPRTDATNNGYTSRLFFKHFLPADAEFYTSDGRPYRGKVTVRVKINLKEIGTDSALGDRNYILDLYTIDTSGTAYDDLYFDKQR